ncbi:MAG TPA: rhodanese-like domain-containing protein [Gammaproteobacteria bacterium]|jgi:thiosulfate/3-mercaptopyruvate sulfurtransferase|nr:rhodanese-like domain-containing protein [Gammaproteobacteria bacterium]
MAWLINAAQVDRFRKNQKNVVILDATWVTPDDERDMYQAFVSKHILGARFFDINAFADPNTSLPNMLTRDENLIAEKLGQLGITNEHKVIFYDNSKMRTSCRALWMMKVFGHNTNLLYILDGGMEAWEKYGGKIETVLPKEISPKPYEVSYQGHLVRTLMQMKENLHHPHEQVIDMRNPVRYAGGPETRHGLRAGHIPGSFCFPFTTMFEADGKWKPIEKIRKQLTGIGVDLNSPIVTTCGSGTTAPILNFALDLLGFPDAAMYDGSWTEWGSEELYEGEDSLAERPVQTSLE